MRFSKLLMVGTVSLFTLPWLIGLSTGTAQAGAVKWERIVGIVQALDVVGSGLTQPGSGLGSALGAAPWVTTEGEARVKLEAGNVKFDVEGLVLAIGTSGTSTGLPIGTPGPVTKVKGTLVCDINGSATDPDGLGPLVGNSVLVDTPEVDLSAQGDAKFNGNVGPLPAACLNEPDIAFLIRIVEPSLFLGRWIAFGAVRIP